MALEWNSQFAKASCGADMPKGALTSFTTCDAYRYFAGQVGM